MTSYLWLAVYFIAGVVQDFFFTLNLKYVAKGKTLQAAIFSFLTIFLNMIVLYEILSKLDNEKGIISIIVYSCGITLGTVIAMELKFTKN